MLQTIVYDVDLAHGVTMQRMGRLFASGDKAAHTFQVRIQNADLSGYSADGYMIRSDQASVPITAKIEGDTVIATLPEACYVVSGGFSLILRATKSDERTAVFWGVGTITRSHTDSVVNVDDKIPSLDDLLAQIKKMEEATNSANTATNSANKATTKAEASAEKADLAAESANAMAQSAYAAATNANSATKAAKTAATKIDDMTVQVSMLEAGTSPTANLELVDGRYNLSFSIPKGDKGATGVTPKITVKVVTGEPGTSAKVEQSGTAENPVIMLTIPRGDTGSIGTLTINGKAPDATGKVELAAADVGAASAAELSRLKGDKADKTALTAYRTARNLLDNSNFTNPVNQRGKEYVSTKSTYFIDRWIFDKNSDSTQNVGAGVDSTYHYVYLSNKNTDTSTWAALYHAVPAESLEAGKYTLAFHERTTAVLPFVLIVDGETAISGVNYSPDENGTVIIPFTLGKKPTTSILIAIYAVQETLVTFDWAALYAGEYTAETLPPYVPKEYATELAECQRYYEVINTGRRYGGFSAGVMNSTTSAYFLIRYKEKRITPTVAFSGTFRVYVNGAGRSISSTSITVDQESNRELRLICSDISNGTLGQACELQADNNEKTSIAISADL